LPAPDAGPRPSNISTRQHNVSPSLLIAATAWLSYGMAQDAHEQKGEQARQRQEADRNPEPPAS
jgi:hypothetical protein